MIAMYYKIKRKYRICRSFVCINGCIILKTYRVKSFGSVLWKNWHIPRIGFMTAYYAVSSYGFLYELQSIVVCFYFKWFAHQDIKPSKTVQFHSDKEILFCLWLKSMQIYNFIFAMSPHTLCNWIKLLLDRM